MPLFMNQWLIQFQEEPYLMEKRSENGKELVGNERYEGYCKDLADLVTEHMRIGYILKLVNDSKYGGQDKNAPSGWNGMVGELIRKVTKRCELYCHRQQFFCLQVR